MLCYLINFDSYFQEMKESHEKEMSQAKSDHEALQQEFEQIKADLKARLAAAEEEVGRK